MNRRRLTAIVVAVLVAAMVIAGAFWLGRHSTSDSAAPPPTTAAITTPGTTPPVTTSSSAAVDYPGPIIVARQFLEAQYTLHATDERPDAWLDRVAPLSTPAMTTALQRQYRDGSGGIGWVHFQQQRCDRTVRDLQAQPSPEAPSTDTSKWLVVNGNAITTCEINPTNPPWPAEERVSTVVEVIQQDSGEWLVNSRVDAG
jgi:hypothetical protein